MFRCRPRNRSGADRLARIQRSERIDGDLRRIVARLRGPAAIAVTAAIDVPMASPLIGRPCEDDLRRLVIRRGMRGCLALHHHDERMDLVRILAIRSHQDSGYSPT